MQTTEKFGMKLFEESDPVLAADFNHNTAAAVQALTCRPKIIVGSYVGSYVAGGSSAKTVTFAEKPLLVFIFGEHGSMTLLQGAKTATCTNYYTGNAELCTLSWQGSSVTWSHRVNDGEYGCNANGQTYQYVALVME